MKQTFFALLALAVPILLIGGIIYMFLHGLYRLAEEWRLGKELNQLRDEAQQRRRLQPRATAPSYDPLTAFDDRPPAPEPPGLAVLPLEPEWQPTREPSAVEPPAETESSRREPAEVTPEYFEPPPELLPPRDES